MRLPQIPQLVRLLFAFCFDKSVVTMGDTCLESSTIQCVGGLTTLKTQR